MSIDEANSEEKIADGTTRAQDQTVLANEEQSSSEESSNENQLKNSLKTLALDEKSDTNVASRPSREERFAAQVEADSRSIFVGNVTSEITPEIIEEHFNKCGNVKRITLLYDKNTGAPKGYAYVEFEKRESQAKALEYNGSDLKGTKISVYKKRTNLPGYRRRFNYQKPHFYYQQQWEYPFEDYQAYGNFNVVPQFNGMSGGPQSHYVDGFKGRGRGTYRGNRRKNQYKNNSDVSQTSDFEYPQRAHENGSEKGKRSEEIQQDTI